MIFLCSHLRNTWRTRIGATLQGERNLHVYPPPAIRYKNFQRFFFQRGAGQYLPSDRTSLHGGRIHGDPRSFNL